MKLFNKKGAMGLNELPGTVLTLVFVAAMFVAGYLVVAGLGDASTDASVAGAVGNVTSGLDNVITYAPTWGTIIGVAILIGIVLVGFSFGRNRGAF